MNRRASLALSVAAALASEWPAIAQPPPILRAILPRADPVIE